MSAFSCAVKMFAESYNLTFAQALVLGLFPLFPSNAPLWCLLISIGLTGAFVALAIFAAKGKLWCFLIGVGLHAADTIYLLTLFNGLSVTAFTIGLVLHLLFLGAYILGIVYYVKADRLLKAHSKDILQGDKK